MNAPTLFDGPVYRPDHDNERLLSQIGRVWSVMRDGEWRTLEQTAAATTALRDDRGHDPHASISAQLRHLRKPQWGAHQVERRAVDGAPGLFEYRLIASPCGLLDGHRDGRHDRAEVPCPCCGGRGTVDARDYGSPPATPDARDSTAHAYQGGQT